ncbi:MAG TPA: hypothetical protein HA367_06265 [Candidatus Methanofastidiosum sp.]|nr:hypothetical protein [Methanofastidiosum sp.]
MDIEIRKLTPEEINELNVRAAQRILAENSNLLADIGDALFTASQELGEARIKVEQLKHYKDVITEQNRALKSVIQNG